MSDPLGSSRHVSPLVRSSTHAPRLTHQSSQTNDASSPPQDKEETEHQIAVLQNRSHGPARDQTQPPSPSSTSETPSAAANSASSPPKKSSTSPLKTIKRRRPEAPPQLSERDDIFATHYLAADSGASTPVLSSARLTKAEAVNQDVAASVSLPAPIPSGTELSSSLSSQSVTSQNMHMAPEQAPYSTSPAPPLSRAGAKEFADDIASSWRLGTPVEEEDKEDWDRLKEKDRSRPNGRRHRSDEQIQATLANEDALGQVRSRKASHYLGLFKENAKEKRQHRKSRERAKEVYGVADEEQDNDGELEKRQEKVEGEAQNEKSGSDGTSLADMDASRPRLVQTSPVDQIAVVSPILDHGHAVVKAPDGNVEWFSEGGEKSGAYPIRLLEEIRAHPVAQQHSKDKHRESSPSEALGRAKVQAVSSASDRHADDGLGKALILPQEAEAEDSDKEHISAATYFPHQAASPDDIQGQEKPGETFNDLGDPAISPLTQPNVLPQAEELVNDSQLESRSIGSRSTERDTVKSPEKAIKEELFTSPRRVNTGLSTVSENEYESLEDDPETEIDELADVDHTPTNTPRVRPVRVKKPTRRPRSPLGAVELKPYKHQVGGHTKVFSFSKQAICKELNNKENQFYEVIERRHPELLDFMPRYLGVLNVTYTKAKRKQQPSPNEKSFSEANHGVNGGSTEQNPAEAKEPQERVISKSKNFSQPEETVARVEYANNMHIIPINLFPNSPGLNGGRPQTATSAIDSAAATGFHGSSQHTTGVTAADEGPTPLPIRPEIANYPSWGATTVNTEMKEKILREVFSPSNVQIKHHRRVRRPLTNESFDNQPLSRSESARQGRPPNKDALLSAALLNSASDLTPVSSSFDAYRGGSAPAHHSSFLNYRERTSVDDNTLEISNTSEPGPPTDRHISRRRSDQGLQRLQRDIDTGERSQLNYFEDEVLNSKDEPMFDMEERQNARRASKTLDRFVNNKALTTPTRSANTNGASVPNAVHSSLEPNRQVTTAAQFPAVPFPTPVNPLQAQQSTDERVRHFLLLEDLTANMSKPCVLDLKMGTRQYGIEANAKKRSSQSKKCSMTTSRQLGVRLCGMQVWNVKKQEYVFEDKYAGRDLKAGKDFQAALRRFLYDGVSSKSVTRHIPVLLDKLARLEQIVSQLSRYRFYASSLLLIYDGADLPSQKGMERGGRVDAETVEEADTGAAERAKATVATSNIDIRLVDFANCVTSQTKRLADAPSPPAHPNMPDRGYVKGLRSLRSYFQRIWMEINTEEAGSWVERGEGEAMAIAQRGAGNADQLEGWRKAGEAQQDASEYSS